MYSTAAFAAPPAVPDSVVSPGRELSDAASKAHSPQHYCTAEMLPSSLVVPLADTHLGSAPTNATPRAAVHGPSYTGLSFLDYFTANGNYMPRTHCLTDETGKADTTWIVVLIALTGGVIVWYLRIFAFWMRAYFSERTEDRNQKLFDLGAIFLLCATCGYAMSIMMYFWPGYRLLALFLLLLNIVSFRFCWNLKLFRKAFAAGRFERELRESLESRAAELERLVVERTAEANRLAEIARRTANSVVITDRNGLIEWTNEGFSRFTGYKLHEVRGKKPGEFLQGPDTDPVEARRMGDAIRAGQAVTSELINYSKSGQRYLVRIEIEPLRAADGSLSGFMAIESDVTEARAMTESLRVERERLAGLVHNLPGVAFRVACDQRSTNLFVSDAIEQLTGYPASDFINNAVRDCASITHPQDRDRVDAAVEEAVRERRPYSIEYRIIHKSGEIRWVNERGSAVFDGETPKYLDGVQFDITALHDAREAAEQASRSKSIFLANMSHEIRTPMTAILGYSELIAELALDTCPSPKISEYVETIRRNGDHLLAIINDILDLSKIEAGKMVAERVSVPLLDLLRDVEAVLRMKTVGRNLALQVRIDTDVPSTIVTDPLRLKQILVNLGGNAVKFTQQGSVCIRVGIEDSTCGTNAPALRFSVQDTGIGLSADELDRLFAAFEQADASTTRRFGGTGLGLRISRDLAHLLGGEIIVKSVKGEGSTFTLMIPAGDHSAGSWIRAGTMLPTMDQVLSEPTTHPQPLEGLRIFLAEDGPDNQRLIVHHLRRAGATVTLFENGLRALCALTAGGAADGPLMEPTPCDLLLTDMQMPELDGYSLARTLRARGFSRPIIALTANAMSGDESRCLEAGCDVYVAKPIHRASLIQACTLGRSSPAAQAA